MIDYQKLVREERARLGLSQAKLGAAVGVTQTHINDLEHGKAKPSLDLLERLCDLFGYDITLCPKQVP